MAVCFEPAQVHDLQAEIRLTKLLLADMVPRAQYEAALDDSERLHQEVSRLRASRGVGPSTLC